MSILAWIVLGAVAGWIASLFMGTNESQGIIMNIVVGIFGAFVGGMAFDLLGFGGVTGFNFYSLFVAVVGAALVLWIFQLFRSRG